MLGMPEIQTRLLAEAGRISGAGESMALALPPHVAEAEAAAQAGRVVSHDRVRPWLLDLAQGERTPHPKPE